MKLSRLHAPDRTRMACAVALACMALVISQLGGARPAGAAGASLTAQPSTTALGKTVTVKGRNFPKNAVVALLWNDSSPRLATAETRGNGAFSADIVVPAGADAGSHTLRGVSGGVSASTIIRVATATTGPATATTGPATATTGPATATRTPTLPTPTPAPVPLGEMWRPALQSSWQWQLTGPIDLAIEASVFDVDLFNTDASVVASLHAMGRRVICYLSAGSWEDWRPDASQFPAEVLGSSNGWPGERWLDIRRLDILGPLMEKRLDLCKAHGFDAVEPDNIDGYTNPTGFPLSYQDQIRFNVFLAQAAHARGLSIGLKNDIDQVADLLPHFDFAINEQCFQYNECNTLRPFIAAGKPVFHVEYQLSTSQFCEQANTLNFNAMRKNLDLDAFQQPCR